MKDSHKHTPAYIVLTIAVIILFIIALLTCCHASGEPANTTEPTITTETTGDIAMASKPTVIDPTVSQDTGDPIEPSTEPVAPTEVSNDENSNGNNSESSNNTGNSSNSGNSGNTGNNSNTGNSGNSSNTGNGNSNGNSGTTTPTSPAPTDPKPTEPAPTTPAPTEPKPTEPAPTEPKPTEPTPTEPKPTEPAPTEPEPTEHVHNWVEVKHEATGHWEDGIKCKCGWTIYYSESKYNGKLYKDWDEHLSNYTGDEQLDYHTSYSSTERYVVDTEEYYTWVCSECGEERTTKP